MPRARKVTDYLYERFTLVGVTGMVRNHTEHLAVLLVSDGFVVWSDGRAVWWLSGDTVVTQPVPEPEELWRQAYARFLTGSGSGGGANS